MDMKGIDLQMALSRTTEAGAQQLQQSMKLVQDQQHLGHELVKKAEHDRQQTVKAESPAESRVGNDQEGGSSGGGGDSRRRKQGEDRGQEEQPVSHPYKGKFIDMKG